jgi:A/G-specific adenine glycosylase
MEAGKKLVNWYSRNCRDLPWRRTKNPYHIWVSEIILQQTRVVQGTSYYERFVSCFPDFHKLAAASETEVLKVWQGLGYYSRARNMHHTAQTIVDHHDGSMPADFHSIVKLKGIGPYTAAAIMSIAFGQPYAVVDGNVIRVMSRLKGIGGDPGKAGTHNKIQQAATQMMSGLPPGEFNQAIMELGALVCLPENPNCNLCPLKKSCYAFENQVTDQFPGRKQKPALKFRYIDYLVPVYKTSQKTEILIRKRCENDIWKNLYDFAHKEYTKPPTENGTILPVIEGVSDKFSNLKFAGLIQTRHKLTHQTLEIRFFFSKNQKEGAYIRIYMG